MQGSGGHVYLPDSAQLKLGNSEDLKIYHDGSVNRIRSDVLTIIEKNDSEDMASFNPDGAVTLFHNGSSKFATKSDGIDVTGEVQCDSLDVDGSGDFTGNVQFRGGGGAVDITANSDIRFASGTWTGNAYGKIQHHNNTLYIAGGTNGIIFREDGSDRAAIDGSGHFRPGLDDTYDIGTSSLQWRNGYFDGTVNADGLDIDGTADIAGELTVNRVVIRDNNANSPIFVLKTDDSNPWALNIGNDSYSTGALHGFNMYQANDGNVTMQVRGNGSHENLYLQTSNGSGSENVIHIDTNRAVNLAYQGSTKLTTKSDGVLVTGELQATTLDINGTSHLDGLVTVAGNILLSASNATITFNSGGPNINCPSANTLDFLTSGTDRLRITSAGDVRVKDFSPRIGAAFSSVSGNFSSYFAASGTGGSNLPMIVERYNDNGVAIEFKRNNSVVGNINVTSTTTNYATSSDHRLKENVIDLDGAITRVKQLAPKRFNFIVDADTTVDGFLAHEAATVVPEAVTGTHNEVDAENNPVYQGIDQSKLVPLLTAALQEAIAKIETLETQNADLLARVISLEGS